MRQDQKGKELQKMANLIENGTFESWVDGAAVGWSAFEGSTWGVDQEQSSLAFQGYFSIKFDTTANGGSIIQPVSVQPNTAYLFTCWVRTLNGTDPSNSLDIAFYDENDDALVGSQFISMAAVGTSGWTEVTCILNTPAILPTMTQLGFFFNTAPQATAFYIDDVSLFQFPFPQLASVWVALTSQTNNVNAATLVGNQLTKSAGDHVVLGLDLGNLPELVAGAQIVSATINISPSGPTSGTPVVNAGGYVAAALFSGGTAGTSYNVVWTAMLSSGGPVARTAVLNVV